MKVVLKYDGEKITCDGVELTINPQATKNGGKGDPVVNLKKVPGWTEGMQIWKSMSKFVIGDNEIEIGEKVERSGTCLLTQEEKDKIAELQKQIDEIKENARKRQPMKAKNPKDMNQEELMNYIAYLKNLQKELGVTEENEEE